MSHTHSNHLAGLEASRARLIFSSAAVREVSMQIICRADRLIHSNFIV